MNDERRWHTPMKISLGPVLYYWDRKTLLDFYARAAETAVGFSQ